MFGEDILVQAEIATLQGTSGHADRDGLLQWIEAFSQGPKQIYVNHGDEDACEAFRDLLVQRGYTADAPFSGTEYDLLSGEMTVYVNGKRIERNENKINPRAAAVHNDLVAAAEELLQLAKQCLGRTNKNNSKFADQIRSLIAKWR